MKEQKFSDQTASQDPVDEQEWLDIQEEAVFAYLKSERVAVDGDLEIQWCVVPYVALWRTKRGLDVLWVISGDLPTDYIIDLSVKDGRTAMKAFCSRWLKVSECLLQGKQHPTIAIGKGTGVQQLRELGDLLRRRAELLTRWTERDEEWAKGEC